MLISVITPTFNRRALLAEAIASVLKQTWSEFEMIIVDDGSCDGTGDMVSKIPDARIRYQYQENEGQSSARNKGLAAARGDFIAFLDSDNVWLDTRLERHLRLFEWFPDTDLVYGVSVPYEGETWSPPTALRPRPIGLVTRQLLLGNFVPFNSVLMRRTLAERTGPFDESLRSAEDYDFWLRASLYGRFLPDDEVSTLYRKTPGSISTDLARNFAANEKILRRFLETNPTVGSPSQEAATWSSFYENASGQWSGAHEHAKAVRYAARAIKASPLNASCYLAAARSIAYALRSVFTRLLH